ncbi:hypothetical protein ABZ092_30515 [Streptomyces bobili]|uniref:hypothetical protein n=1 Tax=Streptomyces bobili TaxID=67280 RepID=UPI0033A95E3C
MSTDTPQTPEQILATADTELHQADDELAALEQAVIDDQDVTPDQIEAARSRRYFAGLRRKAAEKKAERARQDAIDAAARQAVADFHEALKAYDLDQVPTLQERIEQAVFELLQLAAGHDRTVTSHARRLIKYSGEASNVPVNAIVGGYGREAIRIGDTSHSPADGKAFLEQALNAAQQRHYEAKKDQDAEHNQAERERLNQLGKSQAQQDARLYADDRPAFEKLPARRRKPAIEHLGMDWDAYERDRARNS